MLSNAVVHPMLPAADIERAKVFYGEVLGLGLIEVTESVAAYACGGGTVLYVYPSAHAGTNQATAAEFEVTDLLATKAELEARGVTFEEYALPGLATTDGVITLPSGAQAAWFKDTEGNVLGLTRRAR